MAIFPFQFTQEVKRIQHIVQQVLDFSKPVPPRLALVEIPVLLDETLDLLSSECLQRRVEIVRRYEATQPIQADSQQMKQVLLNLILNGFEAMDGLGGRLNIVTAIREDAFVLEIEDTGTGIAPKDLARLGEPFFTTKDRGTGLGLAVVQGIVKEHGGRMTIESKLGRGTCVRIALPLPAATAQAAS